MKRFIFGALFMLIIFLGVRYCEGRETRKDELQEQTALIEEQLKNVGKLVVTEGTFSQVYSYKNSQKFYLDLLSARKKALIIVNAKATVAYDLSKLEIELDEASRTVRITHIPEEEISIYPDIQYYDLTQDYLNQFEAEDYNKIKKKITASIKKKVDDSTLKSNAKNRLITELQKIYILTNSLGWTLEYRGNEVDDTLDWL